MAPKGLPVLRTVGSGEPAHQIRQLLVSDHAFLLFILYAQLGLAFCKVWSHPRDPLTAPISAELGGPQDYSQVLLFARITQNSKLRAVTVTGMVYDNKMIQT